MIPLHKYHSPNPIIIGISSYPHLSLMQIQSTHWSYLKSLLLMHTNCCSQINCDSGNLLTEFIMFMIQLCHSLLEFLLVHSLLSSQCICGINYGISELIQHMHNLSQDSLISEVLLIGQCNQCLNHGWLFAVSGDTLFDDLQTHMEFPDLHQWGITEWCHQVQCWVSGFNGWRILGYLCFEFLMF